MRNSLTKLKIGLVYIYFSFAIAITHMTPLDITTLSLSLLLGLMIFLFIFRIVLTWYPQVDLRRFPFILIAFPTEIFLIPTRKIIPPIGGVDISPIIWVGIVSLIREILLGQQGLLTMMS
jgi:YggT family protein